eukprot:6476435-Amphidinium_carterae.1
MASPAKERNVAERLHKEISRSRTLPPLLWDEPSAGFALEDAVNHAITVERRRRIAVRCSAWKAALNTKNGANALARKMVRGASPRLHVLQHEGLTLTCPQLQAAALDAHWANISTGTVDNEVHPDVLRAIARQPWQRQLITAADVSYQFRSMKKASAHGPDWWRVKELCALPESAHAMLAALYNEMEKSGKMASVLMTGWISPIPKDGHVASTASIRPITVLSVLHRAWSSIRFRHLQPWCSTVLDSSQSAFRIGRSARGEIKSVLQLLNGRLCANLPVYLGMLDLSKAFPKLNREKAAAMAFASGLDREFTDYIASACLEKQLRWKVAGALSTPRVCRRGTPQGCALSILLFQLLVAPAVRATKAYLRTLCPVSTIYAYADDLVTVASSPKVLQLAMVYLATLLTSLDFQVNPAKSSVAVLGSHIAPSIYLDDIKLPVATNPEVFGSTVVGVKSGLAPPDALPERSSSRSISRWIKVKNRLRRLQAMPVTFKGKTYLWRSTILPILAYDIWAVLPNKSSSDAWSTSIIRAVYSGIRGHKDRWLLAATNPQQFDLASIFLHQLSKDGLADALDEPMEVLFDSHFDRFFHTALTAFVDIAKLLGFQAVPEGLYCPAIHQVIEWPPTDFQCYLHQLRQALRQLALIHTKAPIQIAHGSTLDRDACLPTTGLTRTQVNFLVTLQASAHRAAREPCCQLCGLDCGEHGSLEHAIWHCEERSLAVHRLQPPQADHWPQNFRTHALLTTSDSMSPTDIAVGQRFMTRVLIERRAMQRPLDLAASRAKKVRIRDLTIDAEQVDVDFLLEAAHYQAPTTSSANDFDNAE